MKRNTPDHPKMKSLAKKLGIPKYAAVGIMESLWNFTADYCPDGGIGRYTDDQIAESIGWDGSSLELISALAEARWLDQAGEFRLVIHDWPEHADDNVHAKLARGLRTFADGTLPKLSKLNKSEKESAEAYFKSRTQKEFHGMQKGFHGIPPAPLEGFHGSTALPFQSPSRALPEPEPLREAPAVAAPAAPVDGLIEEIAAEMRLKHRKKSGMGGKEVERELCSAAANAADPAAALRAIRDRWRIGCDREWVERKTDHWPNLCRWIRERGYLDPPPDDSPESEQPEQYSNQEVEDHWQEMQRLMRAGVKTHEADQQARKMIADRRRNAAQTAAR